MNFPSDFKLNIVLDKKITAEYLPSVGVWTEAVESLDIWSSAAITLASSTRIQLLGSILDLMVFIAATNKRTDSICFPGSRFYTFPVVIKLFFPTRLHLSAVFEHSVVLLPAAGGS